VWQRRWPRLDDRITVSAVKSAARCAESATVIKLAGVLERAAPGVHLDVVSGAC
jgi:hypothetical protein